LGAGAIPQKSYIPSGLVFGEQVIMTSEEFVRGLRKYAGDSAIKVVREYLTRPPGRKPPQSLIEESVWFNGLSPRDKEFALRIAHRAMDATLFGVFCILDGERVIEEGPRKGELVLVYRNQGEEVEIVSRDGEHMHDIYGRLYPFE
jgi:hypothetical protein